MPVDVAQIRYGRPDDAAALAATHEEAWRGAYQGIIPHVALERMIARRGPGWWRKALIKRTPLIVLDFEGEAAGYATFGRSRTRATPYQGEVFELYVRPVYQGLGLGKRLFRGARRRLGDMGHRGTVVWALADNDAGCTFYLELGGKPVAEGVENFGHNALRKVAFAWP